jgi:hypothetical protein
MSVKKDVLNTYKGNCTGSYGSQDAIWYLHIQKSTNSTHIFGKIFH